MLLPDRTTTSKRALRSVVLAVAAVAVVSVSACTVTPLYQSGTARTGYAQEKTEKLAQVSVSPAKTRQAQEVRNHLIFLLGGGEGEPANPGYELVLNVSSSEASVAQVQIPLENDGRPSAGSVSVSGSYSLKDLQTGEEVFTGTRSVSAAFDRPRQEYSVLRAVRDAENRAARELAEIIRLDIVQNL